MRTGLIVAACILAAVMIGGEANLRLTAAVASTYEAAADALRESCMQKDWERALNEVSTHRQSWERTEKWLQMLVDHRDTDEVTMAMLEIRAGIEAQDMATCCDGCLRLREAAEHLHHRDAFTLGNIL